MRGCKTIRLSFPLVGLAQRALIATMSVCGVFLVSHISTSIVKLIELYARRRRARYIIIYSKLTGQPLNLQSLRQGLLIYANHHEKYYLVDGVVLAEGTANLTDTEFNDQTLNTIIVHVCKPGLLQKLDVYNTMKRQVGLALSRNPDALRKVASFLAGTSCYDIVGNRR